MVNNQQLQLVGTIEFVLDPGSFANKHFVKWGGKGGCLDCLGIGLKIHASHTT
jgi:hypothetical protein